MSNQQSIIDALEAQIVLLEKYNMLIGYELGDVVPYARRQGWESKRLAIIEEMNVLMIQGSTLIRNLKK